MTTVLRPAARFTTYRSTNFASRINSRAVWPKSRSSHSPLQNLSRHPARATQTLGAVRLNDGHHARSRPPTNRLREEWRESSKMTPPPMPVESVKIKQGPRAIFPGAVDCLAQRTRVGIVVHDYQVLLINFPRAEANRNSASRRRCIDSSTCCRSKSTGPPKPMPQRWSAASGFQECQMTSSDLFEHPAGSAPRSCGARLPPRHAPVLKQRDGEPEVPPISMASMCSTRWASPRWRPASKKARQESAGARENWARCNPRRRRSAAAVSRDRFPGIRARAWPHRRSRRPPVSLLRSPRIHRRGPIISTAAGVRVRNDPLDEDFLRGNSCNHLALHTAPPSK